MALEEGAFKVADKKTGKSGKVWTYVCRSMDCDSVGRLITDELGETTFEISGEHTGETCEGDVIGEPVRGLSEAQKNWVDVLYQQNFKTVGAVYKKMRKMDAPDGCQLPTKEKVVSYWQTMKKKLLTTKVEALPKSFADYAATNSYRDTLASDEVFVCGYEGDVSGEVAIFRMLLSTRRLLGFVPDASGTSDSFHSDDTADFGYALRIL